MRNAFKFIAIAILIGGFVVPTIFAQSTDDNCVISAWIEDIELPKIDSNIRSKPTKTSKALLEIPFVADDDPILLEITGYSKGYLKIRKAANSNGKVLFEGTGWIWARRVGIGVLRSDRNAEKSVTLYATASSKGKKAGTIQNYAEVFIVGFSCFGLKVHDEKNNKIGWLPRNSICDKPEAPCIKQWNPQ